MERLDDSCLTKIIEFIGEPDAEDSEFTIWSRFRQIWDLSFVSMRMQRCFEFWYDNCMEIEFHH